MVNSLTDDNLFPHGDEFYEHLMAAHDGLSHEESEALNARLILLMANTIGDVSQLKTILTTARSYHGK